MLELAPEGKRDRASRELGLECDERLSPLPPRWCEPGFFLPCFAAGDKPINSESVIIIDDVDVGPDNGRWRATGKRVAASRRAAADADDDEALLDGAPLPPPPGTPLLLEEDELVDRSIRFDAADSFSHRSKKRAPDKCESARLGMSLSEYTLGSPSIENFGTFGTRTWERDERLAAPPLAPLPLPLLLPQPTPPLLDDDAPPPPPRGAPPPW